MHYINYDLVINKHTRPQNEEEFGYLLAGLVDADGHILKYGDLQITFNPRDLNIAIYIKRMIGSGRIHKDMRKNKPGIRSYVYFSRKEGRQKIANLILNKLRLPSKIMQFNERLFPRIVGPLCEPNKSPISMENHWFAGFVMGDGCFQIKVRKLQKGAKNTQVELVLGFEQKDKCIVEQIHLTFGGNIFHRKKGYDTYKYSSVNLTNAAKLVTYFDKFQVIGLNYRFYLCWKRALKLVLKRKHLIPAEGIPSEGLDEIKKLKAYMTKLRK